MKISRSLLCVMVLICIALSTVGCGEEKKDVLTRNLTPQEKKAVIELRKKAEQGDAQAQNDLGVRYYKIYVGGGCKSPEESTHALKETEKWIRKAADQNNADAQYNLGKHCRSLLGAEGMNKAVSWYRKAADQGHMDAQYELGMCYAKGYGIQQDLNEAVKWFRKAADQGHEDAEDALEVLVSEINNSNYMIKDIRNEVEKGNAEAMYTLGLHYRKGDGIRKDANEAVRWCRKAAEKGFAKAQYLLGEYYYRGYGVQKEYSEAVNWWRKAADQNFAEAQYYLGMCYDNGFGVPQNSNEAVKWYQKAARNGNRKAKDMLLDKRLNKRRESQI